MKSSRMMVWVALLAMVIASAGGCAVHSQLDVNAKGCYQPTYIAPPQVADVHVSWKVVLN